MVQVMAFYLLSTKTLLDPILIYQFRENDWKYWRYKDKMGLRQQEAPGITVANNTVITIVDQIS